LGGGGETVRAAVAAAQDNAIEKLTGRARRRGAPAHPLPAFPPVMLPHTYAARLLAVATDQPSTPAEFWERCEARYAQRDNRTWTAAHCAKLAQRGLLLKTGLRPRPGQAQPLYVITQAGLEMRARLDGGEG
jgi:hypothetical protein